MLQHSTNINSSQNSSKLPAMITELDHDSLDNILSYCPNRACYEIQSMRATCKSWNLLLYGGIESSIPSSVEGNLAKTIKENIRNISLINRIEEMYLPRLYFHVLIPVYEDSSDTSHSSENGNNSTSILEKSSIFQEYFDEFIKIFGDTVKILSDRELEIEFDMKESILEDVEQIISKDITVPRQESLSNYLATRTIDNTQPNKLYYVVKKPEHEEKKLKEHVSLIDLYKDWKDQPIFDSNLKANACRLSKKVILQIIFTNSHNIGLNDVRLSRESTIYGTSRSVKGFLFKQKFRDHINFKYGSVSIDFENVYRFNNSNQDMVRVVVYLLLRHKIIPSMDRTLIDLKQLFERDSLNYIKSLKGEDLYYFLTIRENILKKYRDGLLSGRVKLPDYTDSMFNFKVNYYIILHFLHLVGLETMDNRQRTQFLKLFLKRIYNSQLLISEEKRQEYLKQVKLSRHEQLSTIEHEDVVITSFERIFFERQIATIYHHDVSFPSFPIISMRGIEEVIPSDKHSAELTAVGKVDKCWTTHCCMSKVCSLCNCCTILSCWCATSCCCYTQSHDSDIVGTVRGMGLPKWLGWFFKGVCCYQHRIFPMLDCSHCFDQCFTVRDDGIETLECRYKNMYAELDK